MGMKISISMHNPNLIPNRNRNKVRVRVRL
jgi:hypothetical protein